MIDDATQNTIRMFKDVVFFAHSACHVSVDPKIVAMKAVDMYMQMVNFSQIAGAMKEMGPGIKLDFSKFVPGVSNN